MVRVLNRGEEFTVKFLYERLSVDVKELSGEAWSAPTVYDLSLRKNLQFLDINFFNFH